MTVFATAPSLQELVSHQVCRFAGRVIFTLTTYDSICNSSILTGTGQPPTLQVCRESNLHKDNDGWANCRPVSADLLYTTLDT
jgi:hypothetical protein